MYLPIGHRDSHLIGQRDTFPFKSGRSLSRALIHSFSISFVHLAANNPVAAMLISESAISTAPEVLAEDPNFAIRFIAQAAPIAASTSPNARRTGTGACAQCSHAVRYGCRRNSARVRRHGTGIAPLVTTDAVFAAAAEATIPEDNVA
jgi:hypothetical protein